MRKAHLRDCLPFETRFTLSPACPAIGRREPITSGGAHLSALTCPRYALAHNRTVFSYGP